MPFVNCVDVFVLPEVPARVGGDLEVPARYVYIFAYAKIAVSLGQALASNSPPDYCIHLSNLSLQRKKTRIPKDPGFFGGTGQI